MAGLALSVSVAALSNAGRRDCNEDAFGYWLGADTLVAALCDGAGGHGGGHSCGGHSCGGHGCGGHGCGGGGH